MEKIPILKPILLHIQLSIFYRIHNRVQYLFLFQVLS
ncbi:unnamed protein product [Schistosoma mattheei]|uniref:Uncharacterized protein n=1 Tax=Schistosoma mattheei TaxID=31246 RepID=A0A3P8HPN0_9TREM|nr:unnamed protein product [Schistosoma mattheei]